MAEGEIRPSQAWHEKGASTSASVVVVVVGVVAGAVVVGWAKVQENTTLGETGPRPVK